MRLPFTHLKKAALGRAASAQTSSFSAIAVLVLFPRNSEVHK